VLLVLVLQLGFRLGMMSWNRGRVDYLHHHTTVALGDSAHNQGTPPAGCTTQHQAPAYLGCEPRSSDGSPPNRRADHTDQV